MIGGYREEYWKGATLHYRASVAQANGAGGAIVVDFLPGDGNEFLVMSAHGINSGTNTLLMARVDEDNIAKPLFAKVASAATTEAGIPQTLSGSTSDDEKVDTTDPWTRLFSGAGDKFSIYQTGAGAQNDTLIVNVRLRLFNGIPSVSKARSTNQGDVTIATPTVNKVA